MTVALVVISDGRHAFRRRTLASVAEMLPEFDQTVAIDDRAHELGFAGAIKGAWEQVQTDWVFHLEADFTFNEPVPVDAMIRLLERRPHLAQVALKRQPWNEAEIAAGGLVELAPDDYTERRDDEAVWTEHRRFFTTNPSVYSRALTSLGWPQAAESEGLFTHQLLALGHTFAYWGGKFDAPRVTHIGEHRARGWRA